MKSHHFLLGIDLGTTYLKAILIDEEGKVITEARTQHETSNPKPDYYEQNPIVWWENLKNLLQRILRSVEANNIKGVSFSGQMHGLVLLDKEGAPLIPSITWEDKRAEEISLEMEKRLGWENIKNTLGNKPMPGFTLPKLLWIKRNLPRVYRKTFKVLLPKGFLRYKLTGNLSMELSDASSGLLVNVKNREWAEDIFKEINLDLDKLPKLYESTDVTGRVTDRAANDIGIEPKTPVVAGAGDQQAGAIGGGINEEGEFSATIGTGGQIYTVSNNFYVEPEGRVHTFCHAFSDQWLIMGAMKTAGRALEWFKNEIMSYLSENAESTSYGSLDKLAQQSEPGSKGLIFLPYLAGERTPHLDPSAKGLFFGLSLSHSLPQMVRSVMEGVSYNMKYSLELLLELDLPLTELRLEGGGVKSSVWPQIQADIFEENLTVSEFKYDKSVYGAAVLAGLGIGDFTDLRENKELYEGRKTEYEISPDSSNSPIYSSNYELFKRLYPSVKDLFQFS